jgi:hypothetical protein
MATELATFSLSAPINGESHTTLDAGTVTSPQSVSGRVLTMTLQVQSGAYVGVFAVQDQSGQNLSFTGTPSGAVLTALFSWLQTVGQAKVNAAIVSGLAPAGTTIAFTAG